MKLQTFGQTSHGLPIFSYEFFPNSQQSQLLILGGVHGDEIEGVIAARKLLEHLMTMDLKIPVTIIPEFNPEGVLHKTRGNLNGVDLNRNLSTKDWSPEVKTPRYHPGPSALSEPENQALVKYLAAHKVGFILSLHSWNPMLNVNGDCMEEAELLSRLTGLRIDADMGYPTPGCLGTFTGLERGIPTITYEIQRGQEQAAVLQQHIPAMIELIKHLERKWNS